MSIANTPQPSRSERIFQALEHMLGNDLVGDVSSIAGLLAIFVTNPSWLKLCIGSLVALAAVTYNRQRIMGMLARHSLLTARLQRGLWLLPLALIAIVVIVSGWQLYITYFRNEVPVASYPHTLHVWGDSIITQNSDATGDYYRWVYDRKALDSYTGFEYVFENQEPQNLDQFAAIQLRVGFEGAEDAANACWFYLKESPERQTGETVQLGPQRRYAADIRADGTMLQTLAIPLDSHFPTSKRQQIRAVGFQAGGDQYPRIVYKLKGDEQEDDPDESQSPYQPRMAL